MEDNASAAEVKDLSKADLQDKLTKVIVEGTRLMKNMLADRIRSTIESEGLLTKIFMVIDENKAIELMSPYIGAISVLAFSGRKVTSQNVSLLIKSVNHDPDTRMLSFIDSMNVGDIIPYIISLYFFIAIGKDPTQERILRMASALSIEQDEKAAEYVIGIYKSSSGTTEKKADKIAELIDKPLTKASEMMSKILIMELNRTFEDKHITEKIKEGITPYIVAAGVLDFTGKGTQITRETLSSIVSAAGLTPNNAMIDYVFTLNYGHIDFSYIPVIFFMESAHRPINTTNIKMVLDSIKIKFDEPLVDYILALYENI